MMMKTLHKILVLLLCLPTTATITQNQTVGTLNGILDVSPGGAAVYTITIDLPPGRGGLTPQLALQYNSQGEIGVLGKGWGIIGWSFVERVGTSFYHDGVEVPGAVDFVDDRFSLNGSRIINTGQYPSNSRLETDDLTRITQPNRTKSKDVLNPDKNNHWYWKVQTKDGLTKHFGDTDDSRQSCGEEKLPIRWHLNRIDDKVGNSILYEYDKSEVYGEIYLTKIYYYPYEVLFKYDNLNPTFQMTSYFPHGSNIYSYTVRRIMTKIEVIYSPTNEKIKEYNLAYENGGIFERKFLKSISLTGRNDETLTASNFEWEYNKGSFGTPHYLIDETTNNYFSVVETSATGDFNGDGKTDFVEYDNSKGITKVYMNNSAHEINFVGNFFVGDFFGEGAESILISEITGQKRQRLYSYRNGSFVQMGIERSNVQILHVGDFSGNGLIDMITKEGNSHYFYPGTDDFEAFFTTNNRKLLANYPNNVIRTGRFRGNGQLGLLTYNGGTYVNSFNLDINNGSYSMKSHLINFNPFNLNVTPSLIEIGDFNGDGKEDLLVIYFDGAPKNAIFYSSGGGFTQRDIAVSHVWWDKDYIVADLNNDGITDIYYQTTEVDWVNRKYIINNTCLYKHSGDGTGFTIVENVEDFRLPEKMIAIEKNPLHVGDFSGDGEKEVFVHFEVVFGDHVKDFEGASGSFQNWRRGFYFRNSNPPDDRIIQVINGLGMKQRIAYKPYSPASYQLQFDYPVMKYRYPFSTVHSIETQMPNSSAYYPSTQYNFAGMQVHAQGKGILGFKLTEVTNGITNTQTNTINEMIIKMLNGTKRYFHPYAACVITLDKTTNRTLSRTDLQMDILNLVNGKPIIYTPIVTSEITSKHDNDTDNTLISRTVTLQSISDFDGYGNSKKSVQRATTWQTNPNENWEFNTIITAAYRPPTAQQWVVVPEWIETTHTSAEENFNELIERLEFTYNSNMMLNAKTILPGRNLDGLATMETYLYDSYGNLEHLTLHALNSNGLEDRVSAFEYDATKRFVTKKTIYSNEGDNLVTEYGYYPELGLLRWEKDIRGNQTSYVYNGFGTLTETHQPDGTKNHSKVEWVNHAFAPNGALYQVRTFKDIGNEVWQESTLFFDRLGRELRSLSYNLQGEPIAVDREYDQMGRLYRVSEPFYASASPTLFTSYAYDGLGRILEITGPDGTKTETTYNGRTIRTTNKATNVWSEKISNALGLTDWSKDPAGQINYDYNGRGQLIQVDALWQKTNISYDLAGNQTEIIDPNAGTITYIYNAFGELINQTDANGNSYEMVYDNLGRLKTKTLTSGGSDVTTYEYITSNTVNGFGLPNLISRNNTTSTAYNYDYLGRIITKTETIDGIYFTFGYTYNAATGMLETYEYPSGFRLKYLYNNRGDQFEIRNATTDAILWKSKAENHRGQLTQFTMGQGGIHGFKTFSEHGFPQLYQAYDFFKNIPQTIQDLHFTFNTATGNLISRADNLTGQIETFTYDTDKLHSRLTGWSVNGQTVASLNYNDNGNITKKSDVSTASNSYVYNHPLGKPHAVTGINNPTTGFAAVNKPQSIEYTAFNKVEKIINNDVAGYQLQFLYGPDDQRRRTFLNKTTGHPGVPEVLKYFMDNYEYEFRNNTYRHLHYINGPDGLFAIMLKQGNAETMYYVHKDYLGSITAITDASGNLVESLSYDPWGRRRNPDDWTDYDVNRTLFDRGFTGHEHLPIFGLINMNGRLYDPFLARFLSPDPFVQAPDYTQNYNRYSYCLNNPLKYTDPTGEFFLGTILTFVGDLLKTAFIDGGLDPTSKSARQNAWKDFDPTASWSPTNKAWKIDIGGFKTDPNRNFWGRSWQLISRWTWELPQTVLGKGYSHIRNMTGNVDDVTYYGGATLVNKNDNSGWRWGLTLGPYINSKNVVADPYTDDLFRHEFGHTLQSRLVGPLYLTHVGIPSFIGSGLENLGLNDHNREWYETQANRMSERYFRNHDPSALTALPWDDNEYPRNYNPNWYWLFAHPPVPFMWWLFF